MNTKITKFLHLSSAELANYLLKWKMFQVKAVEENETYFMSSTLFSWDLKIFEVLNL